MVDKSPCGELRPAAGRLAGRFSFRKARRALGRVR